MRTLDEFKDAHKGADIYVIASGASGDHIDPTFFHDKITIGINQVYRRFPTTYLIRKEYANLPSTLKEAGANTIHFISEGSCGDPNTKNKDWLTATYPDDPRIVLYSHPANQMKICPTALPESGLVVSYSTITTAMHLAAHMGARTIILVGHDCGTLDGEANFKGYYTPETFAITWRNGGLPAYADWLRGIESQTIQIKKYIKERYGADVYSLNPFVNFNLEGHKFQ